MTNLQQEAYEDDNGHALPASKIEGLGTYSHVGDGFFQWTCGSCGYEGHNRMFSISGVVIKCEGCEKMILLVRTNCTAITEALQAKWVSEEQAAENTRLKDIAKYNVDQIREIQRVILNAVKAEQRGQ